jgi:hypothetical protein
MDIMRKLQLATVQTQGPVVKPAVFYAFTRLNAANGDFWIGRVCFYNHLKGVFSGNVRETHERACAYRIRQDVFGAQCGHIVEHVNHQNMGHESPAATGPPQASHDPEFNNVSIMSALSDDLFAFGGQEVPLYRRDASSALVR